MNIMNTNDNLNSIAKSAMMAEKKTSTENINFDSFDMFDRASYSQDSTSNQETSKDATIDENPKPSVDDGIEIFTEEDDKDLNMEVIRAEESTKKEIGEIESTITIEDVKATLPNLDKTNMEKFAPELYAEMQKHFRWLLSQGFTKEEAEDAMNKRLHRRGKEINDKYLESHPHTGVITIDKNHVDDLGLTEDEHKKLYSTKSIRLILTETKELESLEVTELPPNTDKLRYVQRLHSSLSHYELPLPNLGDYVGFSGANTLQLASVTANDRDSTILEDLEKKASFVYNHLISSSVLKKYDENDHVIMSYDQFCEKFPYFDLELAIYGIYVASAPTTYKGNYICQRCRSNMELVFNPIELLRKDDFPKNIKDKIADIMKNVTNVEHHEEMYDKNMKMVLLRSNVTQNVYALQNPSIARMKTLMNMRKPTEENTLQYACGMAVRKIYLFDPSTGKYILFDDFSEILNVIDEINEYDMRLIGNYLNRMAYEMNFVMHAKCPKCGQEHTMPANLEDLVFLLAQDMEAAITME